jgi:NB-ARC domain
VIRRRGGACWRSGQQDLAAKLTPAGQVAGEVTDVEQGRDRLAELLRGRACLVVVDNVWTADDVYAFSVLDRRGALLVTTRDAGLVRAGAAEVEVAELSDAQARTLAAGWAGVPEQVLPPPAAETLRLVGNLALGVATVAARAPG